MANKLSTTMFVLIMSLLGTSCAGTSGNSTTALEDDPDQVCLLLKVTGTNIPKKQCRSKAIWEALAKQDREVADEYFRQSSQASSVRGDASPDVF